MSRGSERSVTGIRGRHELNPVSGFRRLAADPRAEALAILTLGGLVILLPADGPVATSVAGQVALASLAAVFAHAGLTRRRRLPVAFAVILAVLTTAHLATWDSDPATGQFPFGALAHVVGSLGALGAAAWKLVRLDAWLRGQHFEIRLAELQRSADARWQRERSHEVDNAAAAIAAAAFAISRATGVPGSLESSLAKEAERLRFLLHDDSAGEEEAFDLSSAVRPVVDVHRAAGLDVACDIPDGIMIAGWRHDVGGVVANLLTNAARHAPGASVSVTAEPGDGVARLVVSDHGPGLGELDPESIFNVGRPERRPTGCGRGIGLGIARRALRRHGGDLAVESAVEDGSCFVATFPLDTRRAGAPMPVVGTLR